MISILMPVKNAGLYLTDCVQSILDQTHQDWELIAVDDGSDDTSQSILEKFSNTDQRIIWLKNTGQGIIDALRVAYSKSKGNMLTRMDADDLMEVDKLETMYDALTTAGPGHVVTGYVRYFSAKGVGAGYQKYAEWLNQLSQYENNFSEIYKECVIPSPCWMVSRDDFERCGAFKSNRYPEDYDLCFRFREAGLNVCAVKKVIHHWRDHSERASRNDSHYLDNRFLELKLYHFLKSDYDATSALVLWGAGKKAKVIAHHLADNHISFRWVCNNPNKIGKHIYDVPIEADTVISDIKNAQFIIAVANPAEQKEIKTALEDKEGSQVFFFC